MRALVVFLSAFALGSCTWISFQNRVRFELDPAKTDQTALFAVVHEVAKQNQLEVDKSENVPGTRVGFFGRPYHYYLFEVSTSSEGPIVAEFLHEARMSSKKHPRTEPEKALLESIKTKMKDSLLREHHEFKR